MEARKMEAVNSLEFRQWCDRRNESRSVNHVKQRVVFNLFYGEKLKAQYVAGLMNMSIQGVHHLRRNCLALVDQYLAGT